MTASWNVNYNVKTYIKARESPCFFGAALFNIQLIHSSDKSKSFMKIL